MLRFVALREVFLAAHAGLGWVASEHLLGQLEDGVVAVEVKCEGATNFDLILLLAKVSRHHKLVVFEQLWKDLF